MYVDIVFHFLQRTKTITVDLFDNPGVRAWAEHCCTIQSTRQVGYQKPVVYDKTIPPELWPEYQRIQQGLDGTKYALPLTADSKTDVTQHHLNVWHRWFTDGTKSHPGWMSAPNVQADLRNQFVLLHDLNQLVHNWEFHLCEWPKPQMAKFGPGVEIVLLPEKTIHGDGPHVEFTDEQRQYHSFDSADLVLDQSIHGKSVMQSFLDNDNPNHWDTTGHWISHGGCKLVTDNWKQQAYSSAEFDQWLKKNNTDRSQLKAEFPLGRIRDQDRSFLSQLARGYKTFNNTTVDFVVYID